MIPCQYLINYFERKIETMLLKIRESVRRSVRNCRGKLIMLVNIDKLMISFLDNQNFFFIFNPEQENRALIQVIELFREQISEFNQDPCFTRKYYFQ